MKKGLIFLAGAVVGAGTAFAACYIHLKKQFDKELESRIESLKASYSADFGPKNGIVSDYNEEEGKTTTKIYENGELVDEIETTAEEKIVKTEKVDYSNIINKMNGNKPYPITMEEFVNGDNDKVTYTYFPDDEVFLDVLDDICPEAFDEVGRENLNKFGIHEPDVLYVRNVDKGTDYEVLLKSDMSYKEYIGDE